MAEQPSCRLDHLELSWFMHLLIAQLDPHVLRAADVIPICGVGLGGVCGARAGKIWILEQVPTEGPQGPSSSESPLPTAQEIKTATQPAFMVTWVTGFGAPIKQISITCQWKGQSSYVSSCFLKEPFTAAVTVHEVYSIQKQQICAVLNLWPFFDCLLMSEQHASSQPRLRTLKHLAKVCILKHGWSLV